MTSAAQIHASHSNAQYSTRPITPEGKARVAQNAFKLGLYSTAAFVRPEEKELFAEFCRDYTAELSPETPLEQTLATEIIHAAWRLRRCATIEALPPEGVDFEELDRIQASVDRARAAAQRALYRALAELRRLQANCVYRKVTVADSIPDSAKQTQSQPARTAIPRSAPCPCGSREKYKRCCGKNAPPVLNAGGSETVPPPTSSSIPSRRSAIQTYCPPADRPR